MQENRSIYLYVKLLIAIVILFLTTSKSQAFEPVDLSAYISICRTSMGAFDGYRNMVSTPPVIGGELYRTTLADLCDLVEQLQKLQNRVADLKAKSELSSTTETSWDKTMILAVSIGAVAASKYYGEPEPTDLAEIEDKRERESMREFYDSIGSGDQLEASRFKDNRVEANKMDEFAKAARQRAMLSESLICPDRADNPDYRAIYEKQLRPLTIERERYKQKRDHYYGRLTEIGPTFLRDDAAAKYYQELQQLRATGIIIKSVDKSVSAPMFKKKAGAAYGDDAKVTKGSTTYKIQEFYSSTDAKVFNDFKESWKSRWKDYVDKSMDSFDSSADIADQCIATPGKPAKSDWLNPDDVNSLAMYERNCIGVLNAKTPTKPGFVFDEVIDRYKDNSIKFAALQAQVWTKESELLKRPVVFDQRQAGGVNLSDKPNCNDEPLNEAALMQNKTKMLEVENKYKEIIATERLKKGMLRDEEMRRQKELADQARAKHTFIDEQSRQEHEATSIIVSPDLGGGQ
jgi:hypothetical protein